MSKIVIVYGSGASHDSGFETYYHNRSCPPPTDRNFFEHAGVKEVLNRGDDFYAINKFREWFLPYKNNISLEELWTAVDLNHKHIMLNTYSWSQENERYHIECLNHGKSSYPFSDVISTTLISGEAGNFAVMNMEPTYSKFKFLGDCGRDLKRLIDKILTVTELWYKIETNYDKLHKLISNYGHSILGYITFNYDLILEKSLKNLGMNPRYLGVNDDMGNPYFIDSFSKEPLILKLHGSLNWKMEFGCNDIEFYGDSVTPSYPTNSLSANSFVEPAIVPPTIFKQEINDDSRLADPLTRLLINQWRGAIQLLKEADMVIIIGYSFPFADYHAQRIFQIPSMIRRGKAIEQKILVCLGDQLNADDELKKKKSVAEIFQIKPESVVIDYKFSNLFNSSKFDSFLTSY